VKERTAAIDPSKLYIDRSLQKWANIVHIINRLNKMRLFCFILFGALLIACDKGPSEQDLVLRSDIQQQISKQQEICENEQVNGMVRAKACIAAVKLDGGTLRLSLVRLDLESIPPALFELEWLTVLNLGGNSITEIPDTILQLTHLKELILAHNQIKTVPIKLFKLPKLEILDFGHNQLTSFEAVNDNTALPTLDSLYQISLSDNKLNEFQLLLTRLKKISEISISKNQLIEFPEELGRLRSLKQFNLASNQLTTLPESFGHLASLEYFEVFENKITHLPETL